MPIQTQFPTTFLTHPSSQIPAIVATFANAPGSVGVFRETDQYAFVLPSASRYFAAELSAVGAAGTNTPRIATVREAHPMVSANQTDASVTRSGTWTINIAGTTYGGNYMRTETADDYVEFVTPAACEHIGVWHFAAVNAGVCKVEIDGDATLANRLRTAQQLVDVGELASTVLVANGGTLNPTDRVWNQFTESFGTLNRYLIADGLTSAAHTVRLTCTGYKGTTATGVRLYFAGYAYGGAAVTLDTADIAIFVADDIGQTSSRWELAHYFQPEGGSTNEFIGHLNTDKLVSLALTVDGDDPTLTNGTMAVGTEIALTTVSDLRHPDTGATDIGSLQLTYTIAAVSGLTVDYTLTWLVAGASPYGYAAMLPMPEAFDRGANAALESDVTLTDNDDSINADAASAAAYLWQSAGDYGVLLYCPNLALTNANFAQCSSNFLWIQDRVGGTINKVYLMRHDSEQAVAINDVWRSIVNYRLKYFADGAEAALAQ